MNEYSRQIGDKKQYWDGYNWRDAAKVEKIGDKTVIEFAKEAGKPTRIERDAKNDTLSVEFADKSGQLVIFPLCSSLTNVSLALLCWVTVSQLVSHKKSGYDFLWCLFACAAVVAVNVTRMAIMGISLRHYATFHSEWAEAGANIIILGLIVGICALGVRRELFQRV